MLTVITKNTVKKQLPGAELKKMYQPKDTIVNNVAWIEETKENEIIKKRVIKKVNITLLVNECKKAIKAQTATEKLEQAQKELIEKGVL